MNRKALIPVWLVTFGAIIISFVLMFGFYGYTNYVTQERSQPIVPDDLPTFASKDLEVVLKSSLRDSTVSDSIVAASISQDWNSISIPVQARFLSMLKRRGCTPCIWFLQVSDANGNILYTFPERANVADVMERLEYIRYSPEERKLISQALSTTSLPFLVMAGEPGSQIVDKFTQGYVSIRREQYHAIQFLPSPQGTLTLEFAAGPPDKTMLQVILT